MIIHIIRAFDADLQGLASRIAEMGRLDDQQIADATQAIIKRDSELARRVIWADDRVDALQREIEEKAITTIARRQPMAVDLREIVGALRISNDLERVGDLAENIAKRVPLLTDEFQINEVVLQLQRMADLARDQLTRVLDSYERRDVAKALDVWRRDTEVDALNTSLFRELLTYMMEDSARICFFVPKTSNVLATTPRILQRLFTISWRAGRSKRSVQKRISRAGNCCRSPRDRSSRGRRGIRHDDP